MLIDQFQFGEENNSEKEKTVKTIIRQNKPSNLTYTGNQASAEVKPAVPSHI